MHRALSALPLLWGHCELVAWSFLSLFFCVVLYFQRTKRLGTGAWTRFNMYVRCNNCFEFAFKLVHRCTNRKCHSRLPYVLSPLSCCELLLFVLGVIAVLAVNAYFAATNFHHVAFARDHPVSQLSQRRLDNFPQFAFVPRYLQMINDTKLLCVIVSRDSERERFCDTEQFVVVARGRRFSFTAFLSQVARPQSFSFGLVNNETAAILGDIFDRSLVSDFKRRASISSDEYFEALQEYGEPLWAPGPGLFHFHLAAAGTTKPDETDDFVAFSSKLNSVVPDEGGVFVLFELSASATWNTLTVSFKWQDAAAAQAGVFSATIAVFSLFFPFKAVAKHTYRACWRKEGKGIDREYSALHDVSVQGADEI